MSYKPKYKWDETDRVWSLITQPAMLVSILKKSIDDDTPVYAVVSVIIEKDNLYNIQRLDKLGTGTLEEYQQWAEETFDGLRALADFVITTQPAESDLEGLYDEGCDYGEGMYLGDGMYLNADGSITDTKG
jgi:hypothetical protein